MKYRFFGYHLLFVDEMYGRFESALGLLLFAEVYCESEIGKVNL